MVWCFCEVGFGWSIVDGDVGEGGTGVALVGEIKEDHLITSKYFGTVLYTIDPGGG